MALPLIIPVVAGGVVLATGGTGAVSTLLTYKIKESNARKKIEAEIIVARDLQHDPETSTATEWRIKGNFFLDKAKSEEDDASSFLQINRFQEAMKCYGQGLDEANTCFDHTETARLLRAIAVAKWKETHALKIFTRIAGPIFRNKRACFQENFHEAIQSFVKAEQHGRETMTEEWLKSTREDYKACLDDLVSITKISLMSYAEWMEYLFQSLEFMAFGDPYKCDMFYKVAELQSQEKDFDGALQTLQKCIDLIEDATGAGPDSPFTVDISSMYTALIKQIFGLAQTAEQRGYDTSKMNILEQCERLVHDVETRQVADHNADFEEVKEKLVAKLCTHVAGCAKTLRSKLLSSEAKLLQVKRENIFEQVLEIYKDAELLRYKLYVEFENEEGDDQGGLTREFFTLFWTECFEMYFVGNEVKVPRIIPDKTEECTKVMMILGRVLTHQLLLTDKIPETISPVFLAIVFMPMVREITDDKLIASCISKEMLLSNILLFVRNEERDLLQQVISGELITEDMEDALIDLYDRIGMQCLPKEQTLYDQVIQMAQSELIVKPKYFAEALYKGVPEKARQLFWNNMTPEQFQALHDCQAPTPSKVAKMISYNTLDPDAKELQTLAWLEEIITEMTKEEVIAFVRFVTGYTSMPAYLVVAFNGTNGWEKVPIAHTCGNVLEISVAYDEKEELKTVLMNVITCKEAFIMAIP